MKYIGYILYRDTFIQVFFFWGLTLHHQLGAFLDFPAVREEEVPRWSPKWNHQPSISQLDSFLTLENFNRYRVLVVTSQGS